jgi:hypothetical protein
MSVLVNVHVIHNELDLLSRDAVGFETVEHLEYFLGCNASVMVLKWKKFKFKFESTSQKIKHENTQWVMRGKGNANDVNFATIVMQNKTDAKPNKWERRRE